MASLSHNVNNFITLKLKQDNYLLWHEQALALAESQDMVGHLTGKTTILTISSTSTTNKPTNEINAWRKSDRLLRGWLIGTLAEEALSLVIGLDTAKSVWDALKEAYAQDS